MSTTTTDPQNELDEHRRETLSTLIGEQVMHTLGQPIGLYTVQVRQLWENHYRVNILIGDDAVSRTVRNSYFLKADGDGNIVASNPQITRQYYG